MLSCLEQWYKQWSQYVLLLRVILYLEEKKLTPGPAFSQLSQPQAQAQAQAQGYRTAIQLQLNAVPHILETEQLAGTQMPAIADYWACMNTHCCNKGKTCWCSKELEASDIVDDYYPIPTELFHR